MYPNHYFSLFPSFPSEPTVFVAMPFDPLFDIRWGNVIKPAIESIDLKPHRVDSGRGSGPILTEILQGISACQLVFADISMIGSDRNENVMYEVGIAHAVRQPNEVVIFRGDNKQLPFDVAGVRINQYSTSPESDSPTAREQVRQALEDALKERDLANSMAVQLAIRKLDETSFSLLSKASTPEGLEHPVYKTIGQGVTVINYQLAISKLLELSLIEPVHPDWYKAYMKLGTEEFVEPNSLPFRYTVTELGKVALREIVVKAGLQRILDEPEMHQRFLDHVKRKSSGISS